MANAVGAKKSYYIVNGSTCGILAAIYAACPQGATVAVARNTHKECCPCNNAQRTKNQHIFIPKMWITCV